MEIVMEGRNKILGLLLIIIILALLSVFDIPLKYVSNLEAGIILKDNLLPHHTMCEDCCRPSRNSAKRPQGDTQ